MRKIAFVSDLQVPFFNEASVKSVGRFLAKWRPHRTICIGDEIDLTHDLEEQVAMSLPLKPLCAEQCKGLCAECGADLNMSSCACSEKAFNFKFSALKDFKVK